MESNYFYPLIGVLGSLLCTYVSLRVDLYALGDAWVFLDDLVCDTPSSQF
jgi:hypothetical protein